MADARKNINVLDRQRGCLVGLAVGDALGTAVEAKPPGTFTPLKDMIGGGPFRLKPGEWTDDTAMALCLADSLVACRIFNPRDQMARYIRWWLDGYMSSNGHCFNIGVTVREALTNFMETGNPLAGPTAPETAGNGSLMRLAPVPMAFYRTPQQAIEMSAECSRTTHGTQMSVDACRYFAGLLVGALHGVPKEELLSPKYCPLPNYWLAKPLHPQIEEIANGSYKKKNPPEIKGTGFVVRTLEAVLWAFHKTNDFKTGCLTVVNLGDDADTTGGIFGQIAGAYYGVEGIPEEWRAKIAKKDLIESLANQLGQII